jgi:hypothetical protein
MTMKQGSEKYLKTVDLLRKAKPVTNSAEEIEREVIRKISSLDVQETRSYSFFDLLFGWTNIVWIRRSLIAVSVMLVTLFVYQQSMIVRQLNWLSSQLVIDQVTTIRNPDYEIERQLKLFKMPGNRVNFQNSSISEEQINRLIESVDKLQADYNNLMRIIQNDPELKELVEKKIDEMDYKKVKL